MIAPDQPNINTVPEIRSLTDTHQTTVLNGRVSSQDIHSYIKTSTYDIVHFACHQAADETTYDRILLSEGETLDLAGVTHIAKLSNAHLIFFNLCNASRFASYLVRHGVPACIYTTIALKDANAWQTPWHFYEEVRRQEKARTPVEFRRIFDQIDPGDGIYGWNSGIDYYFNAIEAIQATLRMLTEGQVKSDQQIEELTAVIAAQSQQLAAHSNQLSQPKVLLSQKHEQVLLYSLIIIFAAGFSVTLIPWIASLF